MGFPDLSMSTRLGRNYGHKWEDLEGAGVDSDI